MTAIAAASVAGCGAESPAAPDTPTAALQRFFDAMIDRRFAAACREVAPDAGFVVGTNTRDGRLPRRKPPQRGCRALLSYLSGDARRRLVSAHDAVAGATVDVRGDRAVVSVRETHWPMRRVKRAWTLASLQPLVPQRARPGDGLTPTQ